MENFTTMFLLLPLVSWRCVGSGWYAPDVSPRCHDSSRDRATAKDVRRDKPIVRHICTINSEWVQMHPNFAV